MKDSDRMRTWTVYYEIPPMRAIYTEHVLSVSPDKAKTHIELTIPRSKVIKVE